MLWTKSACLCMCVCIGQHSEWQKQYQMNEHRYSKQWTRMITGLEFPIYLSALLHSIISAMPLPSTGVCTHGN